MDAYHMMMRRVVSAQLPEWRLASIYSYLSVVYVCLLRTRYEDAFNENIIFLRSVSHL